MFSIEEARSSRRLQEPVDSWREREDNKEDEKRKVGGHDKLKPTVGRGQDGAGTFSSGVAEVGNCVCFRFTQNPFTYNLLGFFTIFTMKYIHFTRLESKHTAL